GYEVVAHQGRRRARPALGLARLALPGVGVGLAPGDGRHAVRAGVEAVQRRVADDVDAAGLVDRERVADRLVEVDRRDRLRGRVDAPGHAAGRHEPDRARPVGQGGDDRLAGRDDGADVDVRLLDERVVLHGDDDDVTLVGGDDRAVAVVA